MRLIYVIFYACTRLIFLDVETNPYPCSPDGEPLWPDGGSVSVVYYCGRRLRSQINIKCRSCWITNLVAMSCFAVTGWLGPEGWLHIRTRWVGSISSTREWWFRNAGFGVFWGETGLLSVQSLPQPWPELWTILIVNICLYLLLIFFLYFQYELPSFQMSWSCCGHPSSVASPHCFPCACSPSVVWYLLKVLKLSIAVCNSCPCLSTLTGEVKLTDLFIHKFNVFLVFSRWEFAVTDERLQGQTEPALNIFHVHDNNGNACNSNRVLTLYFLC